MLRQTTTCSLLASYSQLSTPHSTAPCLFLPSGIVTLSSCLTSVDSQSHLPARHKGHMDGNFCTRLFINSETQFYDFSYCSVQVEQQIKQILLTKSLLKHSLCSAPRKQKASLTTHLNPAQKQVNLCFPGRISSACISCHHSSHFPVFRKVFFCLEATVWGNTIRGFTFILFPKDWPWV